MSKEAISKDREVVFPDLPNAVHGQVVTRFPPEASGYMHLGHIKALLINYHYAKKYNGKMILRFDDTNPDKESAIFEQTISEDIHTLGLDGLDALDAAEGENFCQWTRASDYFDLCKSYAYDLIRRGLAYMDFSKDEEINKQRLTLQPSPFRINAPDNIDAINKNLEEFDALVQGKRKDGCLRAAIDYKSPNGCMRDPVIYRHKATGKAHAYPNYDFSCPIIDAVQGVTHALRSIEYADRDDQYNWFLAQLHITNKPIIMSYRKLNFAYTVLSKRKLTKLVQEGLVEGWDDPRMPTVRGALRSGIQIEPLLSYIKTQLFGTSIVNLDFCKLWAYNNAHLDRICKRLYAIADPIPVIVTRPGFGEASLPSSASPVHYEIELKNHPKDADMGTRILSISNQLLVEKEDFADVKIGDRYTLVGIGNAVATCLEPLTLHLDLNDKDFKSTIKVTWLPLTDNIPVTVKRYGRLLNEAKLGDEDIVKAFNVKSLNVQTWLFEPSILDMKKGDVFQAMRKDYCYVDKCTLDDGIVIHIVPK